MMIFESIAELQKWRAEAPSTLGFVPTMGALHDGHLSLLERSLRECDRTLVSIFVNPTQFNDRKDLELYPRPLKEDLALLEEAGATAVFLPRADDLYADNYRFQVTETEESRVLEGMARPGHFDGVLTIVLKLFQIAEPTKAYFGEKDFQQLRLIQDMTKALFLPLSIVPVPTVRESDGLAMSSRNRRLSPAAREKAPFLYRALKYPPKEARQQLEQAGFRVDYVEERWGRRLAAVELEGVRLIDNVEI